MAKTKILIADDSAFMRKIITNILDKGNYELIEAVDGNDTVEKYKAERPDLTILDIIMPAMNGLDALREIMRSDPSAKVIMVTAVGQEAMMSEAKDLGAECYITKPFDKDQILEEVGKILG